MINRKFIVVITFLVIAILLVGGCPTQSSSDDPCYPKTCGFEGCVKINGYYYSRSDVLSTDPPKFSSFAVAHRPSCIPEGSFWSPPEFNNSNP